MFMTTRRTFLQASAVDRRGLGDRRVAALAPRTRPGSPTREIKIGQTMPYSGPASAYGVIGKRETAYFKMINEQGGINGRKINLHQPRRRLQPAQDRRADPPPRRAGAGRLHLQQPRHAVQLGDPALSQRRTKCRSSSSPPAPAMFGDPEALSLDDRLAAELPDRGAHFRQAYSPDQAGRQDRRALPERRFRQGLSDRLEGGPRATRPAWSSRKPPTRSPSRRSNSQIVTLQGVRRRYVPDRRDAEIRGAGDPQGLRHRLEAGAIHDQRLASVARRDEAGGPREMRKA